MEDKQKQKDLVRIASVKLIGGGMKGAQVVYEKQARRNSREFMRKRTETNPFPVHNEMVELFESLTDYLLDICAYTTNEVERAQLKNELEVTGVTAGAGFVLTGKLRVLGSDSKKVVSLNTPLVAECDKYENFDEVMDIIAKIYTETEAYMSGRKAISDDQLVMKFHANDDEFKSTWENLDEEAKKEMASEILKKLGATGKKVATQHLEDNHGSMVMHQDEMEIEGTGGGKVIDISKQQAEDKIPDIELEEEENFGDEDDISFDLPVVADDKTRKVRQA